jgi:hypothetical protein
VVLGRSADNVNFGACRDGGCGSEPWTLKLPSLVDGPKVLTESSLAASEIWVDRWCQVRYDLGLPWYRGLQAEGGGYVGRGGAVPSTKLFALRRLALDPVSKVCYSRWLLENGVTAFIRTEIRRFRVPRSLKSDVSGSAECGPFDPIGHRGQLGMGFTLIHL